MQTVCVKPQQEYRDINTNVEFAATSPVASNDYYFKTRAGYGKSAGFWSQLLLSLCNGRINYSILILCFLRAGVEAPQKTTRLRPSFLA